MKANESEPFWESFYFISGVAFGVFFLVVIVVCSIAFFVKKRRAKFTFDSVELEIPSRQTTIEPERTTIIVNNQWEIPHEELVMEKKIGKGSFGVVYKGKWRNSHVAIKMCQSMSPEDLENFLREAEIMV